VYGNRAAHAQGLVQAGLREQNGVPGVTDTVGEFLHNFPHAFDITWFIDKLSL
jgi:hypothetical protein